MSDDPMFQSRRRERAPANKKLRACFLLLVAAPLLAPISAWAADHRGETMVASIIPLVVDPAPTAAGRSMSAVFADGDRVASAELAAQRGGAGAVVPITSAPQTVPQIILWDELKAQLPSGGNQGTNRMTIQIR